MSLGFLVRAALAPLKLLFGSDIFISYARADGTQYAHALCEAVAPLKPRIDLQETTPGRTLPVRLRLAIVFSKVLIVVITREALASTAIEDEIRTFLEWSKGPILLVSLDASAERARWWPRVEGLERVADAAGFPDGPPSTEVVQRLHLKVGFWRVSRTRALIVTAVACSLALLGGIGWRQHRIALEEAARARSAAAVAAFRQAHLTEISDGVRESLPHLASALRLDPDNPAIRAASANALLRTPFVVASLPHSDEILSARFSGDGHSVLTVTAQAARLWSARTGESLGTVFHESGAISSADVSRDGSRVVTTSGDGAAHIWDAQSARAIASVATPPSLVHAAVFSPDGRWLLTTCSDEKLRLWNAVSGMLVRELSPDVGHLSSTTFSADGLHLLLNRGNEVRVWSLAGDAPPSLPLRPGSPMGSAAISPDGARVLIRADDAVVWDVPTGREIAQLASTRIPLFAWLSDDGRRVVAPFQEGSVGVWDAVTGQLVGPPFDPRHPLTDASFSSDGSRIVTASLDGTVQVWETLSGKPVSVPLPLLRPARLPSFNADGTRVLVLTDRTVHIWDPRHGQMIGLPLDHRDSVRMAIYSHDGTFIVTASEDHAARIWDANARRLLEPPLAHGELVRYVAVSPDDTWIATASDDGNARLWSAHGQGLKHTWHFSSPVEFVAFSESGMQVVTTTRGGIAQVYDTATGQPIGKQLLHRGPIHSAVFDRAGRRVLTASEEGARLWNALTGDPIGDLMKHDRGVYSATFDADGARVVTASADGTARVWEAGTGHRIGDALRHSDAVTTARFSPAGDRILTASSDKTARLWDAQTMQLIGAPMQHRGPIRSALFSADGGRVVTASDDGTARVWDAATGEPVSGPLTHAGPVYYAAFDPAGAHLITASDDHTARIWDVPAGSADDAFLLADAAQALYGDAASQGADGTDAMSSALTPIAFARRLGSAPATSLRSLAQWVLADPWSRTVTPMSRTSVKAFIDERLRSCNPNARREVELRFLGHEALLASPSVSRQESCSPGRW